MRAPQNRGNRNTGAPRSSGLIDRLKGRDEGAQGGVGGLFGFLKGASLSPQFQEGQQANAVIGASAETAGKASVGGEFDVAQLQQKREKVFIDDGAAVMVAEGLGAKCKKTGELSGECTVFGPAERGAIEAGPSSGGKNGEVIFAAETSPEIGKHQGVRCWFKADSAGGEINSDCEVFDIGMS